LRATSAIEKASDALCGNCRGLIFQCLFDRADRTVDPDRTEDGIALQVLQVLPPGIRCSSAAGSRVDVSASVIVWPFPSVLPMKNNPG